MSNSELSNSTGLIRRDFNHLILPINYDNSSRERGQNSLFFFIIGFIISIPIAPESRAVLFDLSAFAVCIIHFKALFKSKQIRTVILLYCVYIFSMYLSMVINELPLTNFFRRAYTITLLLIEAIALYRLLSIADIKRKLVFILALMLGISMHYFYPVDLRVIELPIKFLLGVPIGVLIALMFSESTKYSLKKKLFLSGCLIAYSGYCMFVGSRTNGGVFFISACLLWVEFGIAREQRYRKFFPYYLLLGVVTFYALTELYSFLAIEGVFGEEAAGIVEYQKQFFGSIILGGRPEVAINLWAIYDSPLIGHGPLSESPKYAALLAAIGVYSQSLVSSSDENILYHSMLFAAGHEAGLLATGIWFYLIYKLAFSVPVIIATYRRLSFVAVPVLINGFWNILFSPLIPYNRWLLALAVAFAFIGGDCWRASSNMMKQSKTFL